MANIYQLPKEMHPDFSTPGKKPPGKVKLQIPNAKFPIAKRAWLFQDTLRDLAQDVNPILYDNSFNPGTVVFHPVGGDMVAELDASRIHDAAGGTGILGAVDRTVFMITRNDDATAANWMMSMGGTGTANRWSLENDASDIRLSIAGSNSPIACVADLQDTNFHVIAARMQGTTMSDCDWFVDGEFGAFSGGVTIDTDIEDIFINEYRPNTGNENRSWKCLYIFDEYLSDGQILELYRDPYGPLFEPAFPMQYFVPAGGVVNTTIPVPLGPVR